MGLRIAKVNYYYYFTILFTTTHFLTRLLHLTLAAQGSEVVFFPVFQG
jgi:hypothetical protein